MYLKINFSRITWIIFYSLNPTDKNRLIVLINHFHFQFHKIPVIPASYSQPSTVRKPSAIFLFFSSNQREAVATPCASWLTIRCQNHLRGRKPHTNTGSAAFHAGTESLRSVLCSTDFGIRLTWPRVTLLLLMTAQPQKNTVKSCVILVHYETEEVIKQHRMCNQLRICQIRSGKWK